MNKYEIYIKPDFNFIHWLNNEPNNYKGNKFWEYFAIKEFRLYCPDEVYKYGGVAINFIEFTEQGKPYLAYHYYSSQYNLNEMWNFSIYDNLCEAWRYITIPAYFSSFSAAVDKLLIFYNKKNNYLCGQYQS